MSDGIKAALIVGGVGVAAYFVVKSVSTSSASKAGAAGPKTIAGTLTSALTAAETTALNYFGKSPPSPPAVSTTGYGVPGADAYQTSSAADQYAAGGELPYQVQDTSLLDTDGGNTIVDLNTGEDVAYGPFLD
jgi:hypothetical protein